MTVWEVKDALSHLTSWDKSQEEEIVSLCRLSLKEIDAMLKSDADRSDMRIACAAAANAFCKLTLKRSFSSEHKEEVTNFKAGDVSITQSFADNSKQLELAQKLYSDSLHSIIPLCSDNGFAFENIKIKVIP